MTIGNWLIFVGLTLFIALGLLLLWANR